MSKCKIMCKSIDMYNGRVITYPHKPEEVRRKFDFHFTKDKKWYYINSSDDILKFAQQQLIAVNRGQQFRIVDSLTGAIVKSSG